MKKIKTSLLLINFCWLLLGNAQAQESYLGAYFGPSLTNVNGDVSIPKLDYRLAYSVGVFYEQVSKKNISFSFGLAYTQKGFGNILIATNEAGEAIGELGRYQASFHYWELPLQVGYVIRRKLSFAAELGISPALLRRARLVDNLPYDALVDPELTKIINDFDLVASVAVELSYPIRPMVHLFTSLSFQQSLQVINTESYFPQDRTRHYGLGLNVGFKYQFQ